MTKSEKDLVWLLLQPDHYMLQTINSAGRRVYKVFSGKQEPVQYFSIQVYNKFSSLFKTDNKNKITLNLSEVRKLHGKSNLKKLYRARKIKHHAL